MTDTLHADHELVALYSEEFAEQYKNAKSFAALAPKGCLSDLRILVERLVFTLAESFQIAPAKNTLHVTIQKLRSTKSVTPALLDLIDKIRKEANKALHHDPEDQSRVIDFEESAQRCLKIFCEVIALYRLSIQGKTDNKFKMIPDAKGDLMQLCYKAMFEDCPEDRYRMTRVLGEHVYSRRKGQGNYALQRTMYLELLKICSQRDGTVMAVRDYSRLKLYGDQLLNVDRDPDSHAILDLLLNLAERKTDAVEVKALFGRAVLIDGLWGKLGRWQRDIAWEFLETAADASIPLALTSLAYLCSRGLHTPADPDRAIQYLNRSVELDDPVALKMMADLQFYSGKKEKAIENYQKAVESGYSVAALDLAKALVDVGCTAEAIKAYMIYLNTPHLDDGSAKIAMAELIIMGAGKNYVEMTNGLMYVVNVVQMNQSITAEVEAAANRVARMALKKLKGNVTHELRSNNVHLFLSFAPNGKIKKFDRLLPDGVPPRPEDLFDFSAKPNQVYEKQKKTRRNDLCTCGSGAKFKHCHGA